MVDVNRVAPLSDYTGQSFDLVLLATKAQAAIELAPKLVPLLAPGGTLLLQYGFINTFWAILATAAIIFAAGLPVCPAARQRDCRVP